MRFYRECVLTAIAGRYDRRLQYQEFRVKSRRETLIPRTPVLRVVIHETPPSEPILAGDSETGSIPLAGIQDVA